MPKCLIPSCIKCICNNKQKEQLTITILLLIVMIVVIIIIDLGNSRNSTSSFNSQLGVQKQRRYALHVSGSGDPSARKRAGRARKNSKRKRRGRYGTHSKEKTLLEVICIIIISLIVGICVKAHNIIQYTFLQASIFLKNYTEVLTVTRNNSSFEYNVVQYIY